MRRWVVLMVVLAVCGALATTVAWRVRVFDARPDLFLVAMVLATVTLPRQEVLLPAWILGLGKDVFSGGPLGVYALLFMLVAFGMIRLRAYAYADAPLLMLPLMGVAAAACEAGYIAFMFARHSDFAIINALSRLPVAAGYTGVVGVLVFLGLGKRLRAARLHQPFRVR